MTAWVISEGAWGWQIWRIVDADLSALEAEIQDDEIWVTDDAEAAEEAKGDPNDGAMKDTTQEAMITALRAHAADPTGDALARV